MDSDMKKQVWSNDDTTFFINFMKENHRGTKKGIKRQCFAKFKKVYLQKHGASFTEEQIENKWKTLMRYYKSTKEHNAQPGNKFRRYICM